MLLFVNTLFLDLASHHGVVACVDSDAIFALRKIDQRIGDHELLPLLENLLVDADLSFSELDRIACVVGPGGFMSLRVGVSVANALADTVSIPLAGVHLSDLYLARVKDEVANKSKESPLLWLHSTKKEELFVCSLDGKMSDWKEPTHLRLADLTAKKEKIFFVGELLPEHRSALEEGGWKEANLSPLEEILPSFLSSLQYKKEQLLPWYGRGW